MLFLWRPLWVILEKKQEQMRRIVFYLGRQERELSLQCLYSYIIRIFSWKASLVRYFHTKSDMPQRDVTSLFTTGGEFWLNSFVPNSCGNFLSSIVYILRKNSFRPPSIFNFHFLTLNKQNQYSGARSKSRRFLPQIFFETVRYWSSVSKCSWVGRENPWVL